MFLRFTGKRFQKKNNVCLKIDENGKFVGEIVLYNFSYDEKVELGVRVCKKYQNKGYAYKACDAVIKYAEEVLHKKVVAKRYIQNENCKKLFEKLNFNVSGQDKKFVYYEKN